MTILRSQNSTSPIDDYANLKPWYRDDMEVMEAFWNCDRRILDNASDRIGTAFQMRESSSEFHNIPPKLQCNKDIILEALVMDPTIIKILSSDLKTNRNFILKVIKHQPLLFKELDLSLRSERYFTWKAVQLNSQVYEQLDPQFQTDPVICATAFGIDDPTLKNCPISVLNNPASALEIVSRCPLAIQNIAMPLREDKQIALAAILNNVQSMEFIADLLKSDCDFIFRVLCSDGSALHYIADKLKLNHDFVADAINVCNRGIIRYVDDEFWQNCDFVLKIVKKICIV